MSVGVRILTKVLMEKQCGVEIEDKMWKGRGQMAGYGRSMDSQWQADVAMLSGVCITLSRTKQKPTSRQTLVSRL